jgi:hypothetical protein
VQPEGSLGLDVPEPIEMTRPSVALPVQSSRPIIAILENNFRLWIRVIPMKAGIQKELGPSPSPDGIPGSPGRSRQWRDAIRKEL